MRRRRWLVVWFGVVGGCAANTQRDASSSPQMASPPEVLRWEVIRLDGDPKAILLNKETGESWWYHPGQWQAMKRY